MEAGSMTSTCSKMFGKNAILAFNDPWHDSAFFLYGRERSLHIESERLTRRKYDSINPMLVFCEKFGERALDFTTIVLQINGELARFMTELVQAKWAAARP